LAVSEHTEDTAMEKERLFDLLPVITSGITATGCLVLCVRDLLRKKPRPLPVINALLWPVCFALTLCNYLRSESFARTGEKEASQ